MKPRREQKRTVPLAACLLLLLLCLLIATLSTGCGVVQTVADLPGKAVRAVTPGAKTKSGVDPVELEQRLLRFAVQLISETTSSVEKLRRGTNVISPAEVLDLKILFATEVSSIASGSDTYDNLLDMTVFVTVARISVERHWQPNVYGDSAQPLLDMCRHFETQIWTHAGALLSPEQQAELREAILAWRETHPMPENVLGARALGLASEVARSRRSATKQTSVFSLLNIDPLAGLDPTRREIAETRLFAERALYVAQVMPTLLRWQTELLTMNAMARPEVQQVVTNTTQFANAVDNLGRTVAELPKQVRAEREEILKALQAEEEGLVALAAEMRQTITAGTQMSTSLNTTLTTLDAIIQRFGIGETNSARAARVDAEPFRIKDYAATAAQMEMTAQRMTEMLTALDRTIGSTNLMQLSAQGEEIVDYAFWKGLLFIGVVLLAACLYRWVIVRLAPESRTKGP